MSHEDVSVFEGIAGNLLQENKYPCRDQTLSESASSRIHRCLSWWKTEAK
jgi:hypothetical protein